MHTHPEIAITRVERFLREVLGPRVHRDRVELSVAAWTAPGEPVTPEAALSANFEPFDVGSPWGRPWGTTWMHLTGSIPVSWPEDGHFEAIIDLGFEADRPGFQAEGTVYDDRCRVVKGVAPRNRHVPVTGRRPPGRSPWPRRSDVEARTWRDSQQRSAPIHRGSGSAPTDGTQQGRLLGRAPPLPTGSPTWHERGPRQLDTRD